MKDIAAPPPQSRADSRLRRRIAGLLESQTLPDGRKIFLPPYSQTEKAFVNRFAFQRADYPAKPAFDCRRIPAAAAVYPRIRALRLAGAKPIYGKLRNAFAVPAKLLYFPESSAEIFYRASAPLFSPRAPHFPITRICRRQRPGLKIIRPPCGADQARAPSECPRARTPDFPQESP